MRKIRTLALDQGSRTSGLLARILLFEQFGLTPELVTHPMDADLDECTADAVVLIGDRAIHLPKQDFDEVWDLGDQWYRWAGVPFVFAMWVARAGADTEGLESALALARDTGLANLEQIAEQQAADAGLSVHRTLAYLRDNLHFHLGTREIEGLRLYHRQATVMGAIPGGRSLQLDDYTTA
jgi:chorismate dehydratase